jgi:chemotaxis protein MotA
MNLNLAMLLDLQSALVVVGGTLLATGLRCGVSDSRSAIAAVRALTRSRFSADAARAELAVHVSEIRRDGVLRGEPSHLGDAEIDEATGAMIAARSLKALHDAHLAHKRRRTEASSRAVRTLAQAADLAPVFGLAGTLVSLSQLSAAASQNASGDFTSAISMAVLTTLYGLLLGHVVLTPLARTVARTAAAEERSRSDVMQWLEAQLEPAMPRIVTAGAGR